MKNTSRRSSSVKAKKLPPFPFVLEELEGSVVGGRMHLKLMFGCHAVYVDDKIVLILRQKGDTETRRDDGIWVATQPEHNLALKRDFPSLRPIELFHARGETGFFGWLNLPESEDGFEEGAFALCRLVAAEDPRVGKIPMRKKPKREGAVRKRAIARRVR